MTFNEFNNLELNERVEALNQYGHFFENHITAKEIHNFYSIRTLFAQVVYNPHHDRITEVRSFKYGDLLNNYSSNFD